MKLKHWQGYGSVEAKKLSKTTSNGTTTLRIKVTGNHECGLKRNDTYDVFNWLVKKFDKTVENYRQIINLETKEEYENGTEVCYYTIQYRTA